MQTAIREAEPVENVKPAYDEPEEKKLRPFENCPVIEIQPKVLEKNVKLDPKEMHCDWPFESFTSRSPDDPWRFATYREMREHSEKNYGVAPFDGECDSVFWYNTGNMANSMRQLSSSFESLDSLLNTFAQCIYIGPGWPIAAVAYHSPQCGLRRWRPTFVEPYNIDMTPPNTCEVVRLQPVLMILDIRAPVACAKIRLNEYDEFAERQVLRSLKLKCRPKKRGKPPGFMVYLEERSGDEKTIDTRFVGEFEWKDRTLIHKTE